MTLFNPKPEIFSKLSELNYPVTQSSQNKFNKVPAITFRIDDNNTDYYLLWYFQKADYKRCCGWCSKRLELYYARK